MIYAAGIDVGSTQTKGIILNDKFEIVARASDRHRRLRHPGRGKVLRRSATNLPGQT